jgi:hypothetical protein
MEMLDSKSPDMQPERCSTARDLISSVKQELIKLHDFSLDSKDQPSYQTLSRQIVSDQQSILILEFLKSECDQFLTPPRRYALIYACLPKTVESGNQIIQKLLDLLEKNANDDNLIQILGEALKAHQAIDGIIDSDNSRRCLNFFKKQTCHNLTLKPELKAWVELYSKHLSPEIFYEFATEIMLRIKDKNFIGYTHLLSAIDNPSSKYSIDFFKDLNSIGEQIRKGDFDENSKEAFNSTILAKINASMIRTSAVFSSATALCIYLGSNLGSIVFGGALLTNLIGFSFLKSKLPPTFNGRRIALSFGESEQIIYNFNFDVKPYFEELCAQAHKIKH